MSYDYQQSRASPYPPANASHPGGAYNAPPQPAYGQPAQYNQQPYGQPPPPQQSYGQYGAPQGQYPPPGQQGGYPPHGQAPPASHQQQQQQPPRTSEAELQAWFQAVDLDRSGFISEIELKQALVNGDWTPFSDETIKMLIRQFGQDGRITFQGYVGLYTYVQEWQAVFKRFDADRSGSIQTPELGNALQSFGFNLNPNLVQLLVKKYSSAPPSGQYRMPGQVGVSFDSFLRCSVVVKHLSDSFKKADTGATGWAQMSYDQFLSIVLLCP